MVHNDKNDWKELNFMREVADWNKLFFDKIMLTKANEMMSSSKLFKKILACAKSANIIKNKIFYRKDSKW